MSRLYDFKSSSCFCLPLSRVISASSTECAGGIEARKWQERFCKYSCRTLLPERVFQFSVCLFSGSVDRWALNRCTIDRYGDTLARLTSYLGVDQQFFHRASCFLVRSVGFVDASLISVGNPELLTLAEQPNQCRRFLFTQRQAAFDLRASKHRICPPR